MPFLGIGLHVLIAIFFAVHVVRSRGQLYWLFILFSFPLLGSLVYFLVIYLPQSRLDRGLRQATAIAIKSLDPGRELRDAQAAFDLTPTAQNQMRIAYALLEAGEPQQAAQQFDLCLQGPFAKDAEIRFGAARAKMLSNQASAASALLAKIHQDTPTFRPEDVALLTAHALAAEGRNDEARQAYSAAVERFGSVACRAEFAIWSVSVGDLPTAQRLSAELEHVHKHMTKHARSLHQPLFKRLQSALSDRSGMK
ncbi:hypothetical protein [Undibacterium sp.]|jgi:hypothetical protein|uniref:hypothetical protein n=1 Tax=Undibacterium sp. TaxID=1914977 RepID=UPI002BAC852D|nr:hypothetical protein [Undibacterium sp.]HTD05356.1 hypothetical protein [Undibacterium sp.]